MLQRVRRDFRGFTEGYGELQGVTVGYKGLQGVPEIFEWSLNSNPN